MSIKISINRHELDARILAASRGGASSERLAKFEKKLQALEASAMQKGDRLTNEPDIFDVRRRPRGMEETDFVASLSDADKTLYEQEFAHRRRIGANNDLARKIRGGRERALGEIEDRYVQKRDAAKVPAHVAPLPAAAPHVAPLPDVAPHAAPLPTEHPFGPNFVPVAPRSAQQLAEDAAERAADEAEGHARRRAYEAKEKARGELLRKTPIDQHHLVPSVRDMPSVPHAPSPAASRFGPRHALYGALALAGTAALGYGAYRAMRPSKEITE